MVNLVTKMGRILSIDKDAGTLDIQGGATLENINKYLEGEGFCLSNLPSVSDLTFSGLIATGTHATGLTHKILAV